MRIRTKLMLYTIFAWLSFVKVGTEMIWKFRIGKWRITFTFAPVTDIIGGILALLRSLAR